MAGVTFGERRVPLERRTELRRTPFPDWQGVNGSLHVPSRGVAPLAGPDPRERTGGRERAARRPGDAVPYERRIVVYGRDWDICVRCGTSVTLGNRQLQHRLPRGMGGRVAHDRFSALILLCGWSSTDPNGCHHWVESNRDRLEAEESGLIVPMAHDPLTWPVRYPEAAGGGLWLLDDEGDRRRVA